MHCFFNGCSKKIRKKRGRVGRPLVQLMHFSAIFAMLSVLATSVTCATHSEVCEWGCCDSICLLGYERTFYTNSGLVNGPLHNPRMQFFISGSSKIEVRKPYFFDIVIT